MGKGSERAIIMTKPSRLLALAGAILLFASSAFADMHDEDQFDGDPNVGMFAFATAMVSKLATDEAFHAACLKSVEDCLLGSHKPLDVPITYTWSEDAGHSVAYTDNFGVDVTVGINADGDLWSQKEGGLTRRLTQDQFDRAIACCWGDREWASYCDQLGSCAAGQTTCRAPYFHTSFETSEMPCSWGL